VPRDGSDDYYGLLGVDPRASDAEVRRAWRRLALRWHPDRAGASATHIFQKLSAAYAALGDPASRAAYDRRRDGPPARAPSVLLQRLSSPLNALLACGLARRADDGLIELYPNDEEAASGGIATISMRVPVRRAGGGVVEELFAAWLTLPPGVADGAVLAPSVDLPGMIEPVRFRVRRL
jgi:curved DNA-binding protein CbpA